MFLLRISIDYKVAIEESYDLRAYALVIRRKCFCRGAFCHADFDRPVYCICIKCMLRDICKTGRFIGLRIHIPAPEKCNDLGPGDGRARLEVIGGDTGGDAFLGGPQNGFVVKTALWNIDELADGRCGLGASGCPPQEGDDLSTGAACIRTESRFCSSVSYAFIDCPQNSIIVVCPSETSVKLFVYGSSGSSGRSGFSLSLSGAYMFPLPSFA